MKILRGKICRGTGAAADNLRGVMDLIESRMGLNKLQPGTLNVKIEEQYIVFPDATISPEEYGTPAGIPETIKLQRCLVLGLKEAIKLKAIIMRPNTHEPPTNFGHGSAHLELMSPFDLKSTLGLKEGDEISVEVEGDNDWWNSGLDKNHR